MEFRRREGGSAAGEEISEKRPFRAVERVILGLEGLVRKEGLLAWEWGLDFSGRWGRGLLGGGGRGGGTRCVGREDHQGRGRAPSEEGDPRGGGTRCTENDGVEGLVGRRE